MSTMFDYISHKGVLGCAIAITALNWHMCVAEAGPSLTLPLSVARALDDPLRSNIYPVQDESKEFSVADVSGPPGIPLPLAIELPFNHIITSSGGKKYTFLMVRSVPKGCKLSTGFRTQNAYIVSIDAYRDVSILPAADCRGRFQIRVLLYRGADVSPLERTAIVSIGLDNEQPTSATEPSVNLKPAPLSKPLQKQEAVSAPPPPSSLEEADALAQGKSLIETGNVVYARLIFEDLALRGSARGAFSLAQTFDPEFLRSINVVGLQPDLEKARTWYRKAAALGNQQAAERLASISQENP